LQAHSSFIFKTKQSPFNSEYVATGSFDGKVKIWDSSKDAWTLIQTYSQHSSGAYGLEWLDYDTLASCGYSGGLIKIWSLSSGQTKTTIKTLKSVYVNSLKMLNNRIHLAAGVFGDINIYNINDGNLVSSLQGHTSYVFDIVQISNDILASSSDDYTVRIWNSTKKTCNFVLQGHSNQIFGLKQITSSILASGSADATIKLWNITSSQLIRTLTGHTSYIDWSLD
jgi:WD40 repeat protein